MSKTPKPLQIAVHDTLLEADPAMFDKLHSQGHLIVNMDELNEYIVEDFDLILGPNCWRMTPALLQHINLAMTGARALRYPRAKEKKT